MPDAGMLDYLSECDTGLCPHIEQQCDFWIGDIETGDCVAAKVSQCPIRFKSNLKKALSASERNNV